MLFLRHSAFIYNLLKAVSTMNNLIIKLIFLSFFSCFIESTLSAQIINMPAGTTAIDVKGGELFYDDGGAGNYARDDDRMLTFNVPDGAFVRVVFTQFDVENQASCNYDWLKIFDGSNDSTTEIGTYCGTNSPGTITSTGNSLTFKFHSDYSVENPGWEAQVEVLLTVDIAKSFDESCAGTNDGLVQFYETSPSIDSNLEFSIDNGNSWQSSPVFTGLSAGNLDLRIKLNGGGSVSPNYPLTIGTAINLNINVDSKTDANCNAADGSVALTVSGGRSGSLITNGATGMVDLQTSFMSNLGSFTMEGWVKLGAARATYTGQKSFFGQNDAIEFGFENGNLACWTAGGGRVDYPITNYPDDLKWHHVAIVGTGTNLILYIDGNEVSRNSNSTTNYGSNSSYSVKIGAGVWDPGATSEPFNGVFSHVRFWDIARTQTQISTWKDQSILGDETNLLAVYRLDVPPDGNKIYGVGNRGTIAIMNSGATWSDIDPVYTFAWTGPNSFTSSNEDLTGIEAGSYNLMVTDLNSCTVSQAVAIGEISNMIISDTHTPILCHGGSTSVNILASGGVGPYTGTGSFSQSVGETIYTVSDVNGCSDTYALTLSDVAALSVSSSISKDPICEGEAVNIAIDDPGDYSVNFEGTNGYVLIPNSPDINTSTVNLRTIMMWFRPTNISQRQVLFEEGGATKGFSIYIENNKINAYGWDSGVSWTNVGGDIISHKWQHVCFTWNNAGNSGERFKVYIDGILAGQANGNVMGAHSGDVRIGNAANLRLPDNTRGSGYFYSGKIDEFKLWNAALSLSQIHTEMTAITPLASDLIVHYNFNDQAASVATDISGGNNGSMNGTVVYVSDYIFLWDDPTAETSLGVEVNPTTETTYTVTLTGDHACVSSKQVTVHVTPKPKPIGIFY